MSDEDSSDEPSEVEIRLTESEEFRRYPVSGARGELQGDEFRLDLYYEMQKDTGTQIREITSEGQLGELTKTLDDKIVFEREKQTGVVMPPTTAFNLSLFILSHILGKPQFELEESILEHIGLDESPVFSVGEDPTQDTGAE